MNILITGGTGYLGSRLLSLLLKKGHQIFLIKRPQSSLSKLEEQGINLSQDQFFNFDCYNPCNDRLFNEWIQYCSPDMILHTATIYQGSEEDIAWSNWQFPWTIFQNMKLVKKNQSFIFVNIDTCLPETVNPYAFYKKKLLAELKKELTSSCCKLLNLEFQHFYGKNDGRFIHQLIEAFRKPKDFIDLTSGLQERDFIFIDDALRSIELLIAKIPSLSKNYYSWEIGSGKSYAIKDVVLYLQSLTSPLSSNTQLNFGSMALRPNEPLSLSAKEDILSLLSYGEEKCIPLWDGLAKLLK